MNTIITKERSLKKLAKFLVLFLFLSCQGEGDSSKERKDLYEVKRGEIAQKVTSSGNVHPEKRTVITAPFEGYIKKLYVGVGDKIKKNAPIVSVVQTLLSNDPVYPLRAPFSGVVVDVNKDEGEYVRKGDLQEYIIRIDRLDQLIVVSKIAEIDIMKVKKGQHVKIKVSSLPTDSFEGRVSEVSLAPVVSNNWRDESKVEYKTEITISDPEKKLRPGMSVILDIETLKKDNVLKVPHEYIIKDKEGYFVFSAEGEKKEVKVGISNDSFFEVTEGISAGEQLKKIDLMSFFNGQNESQ